MITVETVQDADRNINIYLLNIVGVMENVLSLYPSQSWDTSILPVLSSYGEPFMDVVCRDSCDGHDVGRVSMLSYYMASPMSGQDEPNRTL